MTETMISPLISERRMEPPHLGDYAADCDNCGQSILYGDTYFRVDSSRPASYELACGHDCAIALADEATRRGI